MNHIDDTMFRSIRLLESRGYVCRGGHWSHPNPHNKERPDETAALVYLFCEWDYTSEGWKHEKA